mgnify:CR=1 FL=1
MRTSILAALGLALLAFPALAQSTPSPIIEHFRAYREALDRQDFETAASEAELALAASETRDGDGGHTPALSLNLATARLLGGDAAGALAPAQRALALAQAGATAVDVSFASLVLGRAELITIGRPGADRLRALLANSEAMAGIPVSEVFAAASSLGVWANGERNFEMAEAAWAIAAAHAEGSLLGAEYGLGRAKTWQAVAILLDERGGNGRARLNLRRAQAAYILLWEAERALRAVPRTGTGLEVTIGEQAYGDALAWRAVLVAKMHSDDLALPPGGGPTVAEVAAQLEQDSCIEIDRTRAPEFPQRQARNGELAGLAVRLHINALGEIDDVRTVSIIGDESFARAVEGAVSQWRVIRRNTECNPERTIVLSVVFRF